MTLDPVHVDGIATLAGRLEDGIETTEQQDFAETVWAEFLDPLCRDNRTVLEPVSDQFRKMAALEAAALQERPFPTQHGLDSGTINPTTFKNGMVLDVAQAAMAGVPSDLDLHRSRTIIASIHSNDVTAQFSEGWQRFDDEYSRKQAFVVPRVDRYEQDVVHALALYLAESAHALEHAETVTDLLILDGPLYPTGLLTWADHDPELAELLVKDDVLAVVERYVELVETFIEAGVPLLGFVKSTTSKAITRAIRGEQGQAPWANDAGLFRQLLERTDDDGGTKTDALSFTNWFRSRVGTDHLLSVNGDALGIERRRDPADYEVTFFVVYDPRDDLLYRIEAPYAFTQDPTMRDRLTRQILADVAAERGPPLAVQKADELARIGGDEKRALRTEIERRLDSERQRVYNDKRWGSIATDRP
jgi:hypothetical protein